MVIKFNHNVTFHGSLVMSLSIRALEDSHGVSIADVLAGSLDDGLTCLVERSVNAVVGSRVSFLDQSLELRMVNAIVIKRFPKQRLGLYHYLRDGPRCE